MFNSIWYLIKIVVILGLGVFLATQPGRMQVTWNEYTITAHLGIVFLFLFLVLLGITLLTGMIHDLFRLPEKWRQSRIESRRSKGHQAIVRALSAASAGDYKNAYYLAYRAQQFLPEREAGLSLLLQAHTAKNRGHEEDSENAFKLLLQNADTAILGVQGLIQKAMMQGDYPEALRLARESAETQPRNYYLLKPVYDLEIKNRLWNDALVTLDKLTSKKVMQADEAKRARSVIYIIVGDHAKSEGRYNEAAKAYKKAFQADPEFTPAAVRLANANLDMGQRTSALAVVKRNWTLTAHPDLLPLWRRLCPVDHKDARSTEYKWFEWVIEFHPDSQEAILALANIAIDHSMWGEARAALMRAEKIRPTKNLYLTWVRLEEATGKNSQTISQWLDRAAHAPQGPQWICARTHRVYEDWVPIVEPEGYFNSLHWSDILPSVQEDSSTWLLQQKL